MPSRLITLCVMNKGCTDDFSRSDTTVAGVRTDMWGNTFYLLFIKNYGC